MKKLLSVVLSLTFVLSACSPKEETTDTTAQATSEETPATTDASGEQQTLVVANWKGYGSDSDYGELAFEQMYNCNVEHQYFTSLEEMTTMLKQGGIGNVDVALPNSGYIKEMEMQGLIQPIDTTKISSYENLAPELRDFPDAINEDGKVIAVPWTWGTTSLGYNPEFVTGNPTTWGVLWDDQYAGKIGFFDDYATAIVTAALYLKEPDPMHPDLEKVKTALLDLKGNTKTYWASYDDLLKPYKSNEIVASNFWSGAASQAKINGDPIEYVYPDEGTYAWADYWVIVEDAPNYDLALKWVDFMTGEQFQTAFATDANAHTPVNINVINSLTDDQKKALWIYPEAPTNIVMQGYQTQEEKTAWLEIWNEVKSAQ